MKNLLLLFAAFLLLLLPLEAQQITREQTNEPVFFKVRSHDPNFKNLPQKSFYESKADWQFIIDTTWGPGLPLQNKRDIFNHFADLLYEEFDGFESLNFTFSTWDSLRNYYYVKIDSNTSRGRFAGIMFHFARQLSDIHTWAHDIEVVETPLNPGVPLLVLGGFVPIEHFGAVLSVLEDSTIFVFRAVNNHPLGLEPGDIILGYNGELWVDIIRNLMDVDFPAVGGGSIKNGGTSNSSSTITNSLLVCAGMNWHLFDTIDIIRYSTGDTLHLSVLPLLNLNLSPMRNNEQIEIPSIPFPDYFNNQAVTYGTLPNSNIGYINVCSEAIPTYASANQQFNDAVMGLQNADALIIDMRWNEGGNAFWQDAFGFWTNETIYTLEWAFRCNINDFTLCFDGDIYFCSLQGRPPGKYQRPIAVLLGPLCKSMGDINAYRLSYLDNVKTFGRATAAGLGWNILIEEFQGYNLRYSIADIAHISDPSYFLNRREFPIDFPVWHNRDDVALGKDAVVESALDWINNLVYAHDLKTDKEYYIPGTDSIVLNAQLENPNSHQATIVTYIKDLQGSLIDSVILNTSGDPQSETCTGVLDAVPIQEDFFKLVITAKDLLTFESFTLNNVSRFTTAGPIVIDSVEINYNPVSKIYRVKPHIKNNGQSFTVEHLLISMFSEDSTITSISGSLNILSIAPGETIVPSSYYTVRVDSNFSDVFRFNFDIMSDGWTYWKESTLVVVGVEDKVNEVPTEFLLSQNYPNPFNSISIIKYSIPKSSQVTLKIFNVLGSEIETLVNEEKPVGTYELNWNAANLPSGVYFYRLQAGSFVQTRKMILLK